MVSIAVGAFLMLTSFVSAQERFDRVLNLEGKWKFQIGDKNIWSDPYFNDKGWESIYVPSEWEEEGFHGYDGYAWYRTSFDGTKISDNSAGLYLSLGRIDDVDQVYLNGHLIGSSGGFPPRYRTAYSVDRKYFIPRELLKPAGKNVIAVRVFDEGIEGGIVSGDVGIYTSRNDVGMSINLRGVWEFRTTGSKTMRMTSITESMAMEATASTTGWNKITVPAMWENQGYRDYDGGAWYRKSFVIPKELEGDDLVFVLGKIDDSDRTFLNGELIGDMTDSWQQVRYYHVSASQVKAGKVNTLVIYVEDRLGDGGIFEGPVGVMKQSDFTRYMRWRH